MVVRYEEGATYKYYACCLQLGIVLLLLCWVFGVALTSLLLRLSWMIDDAFKMGEEPLSIVGLGLLKREKREGKEESNMIHTERVRTKNVVWNV